MGKGIIYIMSSVVPGLIKIGKTDDFENRMKNLERNGYRNITGLKRVFAIEVEDYDEKEAMLHTIFAKSRISDTEMFALDVNIAMQLLSSFDGNVIYPKTETKSNIFDEATESNRSKLIPDGIYKFSKKKMSDNKTIKATAQIENGRWTLKAGSILGMYEDVGVSKQAKLVRALLQLDAEGKLLEDFELGECSPSHAGAVVLNQSNNGWDDWKTLDGKPINIYKNNISKKE